MSQELNVDEIRQLAELHHTRMQSWYIKENWTEALKESCYCEIYQKVLVMHGLPEVPLEDLPS